MTTQSKVLKKIDHIGIAVKNLEESIEKYKVMTGITKVETEYVESQDVLVAMFKVGESKIELLQGKTEASPISKFLEKNREGLHHVCYEVDDIIKTLEELANNEFKLLDKEPRDGAGGKKIAFVHPKSTVGVLTELVQK